MVNFDMIIGRKIAVIGIYILISTLVWGRVSPPTTMVIQANISIDGQANYSGTLPLKIGIYTNDSDSSPVWEETFDRVPITNGVFGLVLGNTRPLSADVFSDTNLRMGVTPFINGEPKPPDFISLKAVPYAFHAQRAQQADRITNEQLIKLDADNQRVGINTTTPQTTLDVAGTVNATAFVGDGAGITNIQVSDDRLVWKKKSNSSDIYYTDGQVGIHTNHPSATLHVSGNVIVSGNLTVDGRIHATTLTGDGSGITQLNASQITEGTLSPERVSGNYTNITGVGTITKGQWQGTALTDDYVANNLTLSGATITGTNTVSGNIQLTGPTTITGDTTLALLTPDWSVTNDGQFNAASIHVSDAILLTKNAIVMTNTQGLEIKPNATTTGLFVSPAGFVGIGTTNPKARLAVNGGLHLGHTTTEIDGALRFNEDTFEGYKNGRWVPLDNQANGDPYALHSPDNAIKNRVFVNNNGNVGIGGLSNNDITDHLTVSGNAVFSGKSWGENLPPLNVAGAGTRMLWHPKKNAFRAGYVTGDQWDDANIGVNSIVFGHSGKATAPDTTIIGGKENMNQGANSVILGGQNNHIENNSDFSVIVGGGGANNGNRISGGNYSTILGGNNNTISSDYATILGGNNNTISGDYSVAMGQDITIEHSGTIVFSDGQQARESSGNNQFLIYAEGNVGIGMSPDPNSALNVNGTLRATQFSGDGSELTNIAANKLGGYPPSTTAQAGHIYVSNAEGHLPENTVSGLSIRDESITSIDIKDNSISGTNIQSYAIDGSKIKANTITADNIAPGAITSPKIQNAAISGDKIQDDSIVSKNIATHAIQTHHMADGQVTGDKIDSATIESRHIVDGTIVSNDIANAAITSVNIANNAIQAQHMANNTIVSDNISENAIQAHHLNDTIVTTRIIADNAIESRHLTDGMITAEHIADNAIESRHINNNVIANDRIIDNSITSDKIANNAIQTTHLTDDIIEARHIADNAIVARHIAADTIDGTKLADAGVVERAIADGAITSAKLADDSVTSNHIVDESIQEEDFGLAIIPATLLADNSITSINIAANAVTSDHLQDNSVSSNHIMDFSITADDIQDNTIDAAISIDLASITSDKIQNGAIQGHHIADGVVTSKNIKDGDLPWEKITTDPIPEGRIANNAILGTKIKDNTIPGNKIMDGSITSEKLANESIRTNALVGTLSVAKGGTGLTDVSQLANAVIRGTTTNDNTTVLGGDSTTLHWDNTTQRLGVNTANPLSALHVKGNVFTEDGGVYFGSMAHSITFGDDGNGNGFIIVGPETTQVTADTEPTGTLKTNQLYVADKIGIGISDPTNTLDIGGENARMAIGENFAGTPAPANGLIVEGRVGIGTNTPEHQLDVNGTIQAKHIIGKAMDGEAGIGIEGIGGAIGIQSTGSDVGIDVTATGTGVRVASTGRQGVSVVIQNADNYDSHGVHAELNDTNGTSMATGTLGRVSSTYAAGIYATASTRSPTNWAAYFDGPVRITQQLGIGLNENELPQADLHVKGTARIQKTLSVASVDNTTNNTIDWTTGNHQRITSCNASKALNFTHPSPSGSYLLSLTVIAQSNCRISFNSTIKWEKGMAPSTEILTDSSTYIYSFLAQTDTTTTTYYGLNPVEFKE